MGDAIVSAVAQRLIAILEEQIRNEVNLVRGVKKEVRSMATELNRVRLQLDDADRRGYQDKAIKDWLRRLEDTSYEMDDVLDEWNISLHKLQMEGPDSSQAPPRQKLFSFISYSPCLCFKKVAMHRDIAIKIKDVKAQLDVILEEGKRYDFISNQRTNPLSVPGRNTTSFIEVDEVKGRDNDRDILVNKLIGDSSSSSQGDRLRITSVVGQGGIGKTTLAQLAYNDSRVKDCFPLRIWICVSDPFDEASVVKEVVEQVQGCKPDTDQPQGLLELLTKSISGKKFLLVLDDVWNGENSKWGPLKSSLNSSCAAGSRILVTTRNERVAIQIGTTKIELHHLELLSDNECWLLLRRIAFFDRNSGERNQGLLDISWEIARKCKGLPLAAKALGSLLRFKNTAEEWRDVLNNEIWQLESSKVDIFPHLLLSYNELSPAQKRCFSYCAVFPKDHEINVDELIKCWMALGYLNSTGGDASELELRGREYFDNLAMRSLFQDFKKDEFNENIIVRCKMHDIVHDFVLYLRGSDELNGSNGRMEKEVILGNSSSCQTCSPLDVSCIKKYRSMFLSGRSFDLHVCDRMKSLRSLNLRGCGLRGIPTEVGNLIHMRFLVLSENSFTSEDLKRSVCRLYNLQTLLLSGCWLVEIPSEIGNLIQLRHLDLKNNFGLRGLPESICDLLELRTLDIEYNDNCELPQGIDRLLNLKHLNNYSDHLKRNPQGLAQLTNLRTLGSVRIGGSDLSKLGCLKNLNNLSGSLELQIKLGNSEEDDIEDARRSELSKKIHLQKLGMNFKFDEKDDGEGEEELCRRSMNVLDALKPNPNLPCLWITGFKGTKFPEWIMSPIYQLKRITLQQCHYLSSLPPLEKLPCLEELEINIMHGFEYVGREFLGITSSSSTTGFPKLKVLWMSSCSKWKEWEDITAEEEESATVSVLPSLTTLAVLDCKELAVLPHRLLRKAPLLQKLYLEDSDKLVEAYEEEGPLRKFISHIPNIQLSSYYEWKTICVNN